MDQTENTRLFIGGVSNEINEETLKEHFSRYGEVKQSLVISKKGIGFVSFADPSMAKSALEEEEHIILDKKVDVKPAKPKMLNRETRNKIFVGGLPSAITLEEFRSYFESYGTITDAVVIYDKEKRTPRGFGFVTFDSEEAAKNVLQRNYLELNNKTVEVKRAEPRNKKKTSVSESYEYCLSPVQYPHGVYDVNTQPVYYPYGRFNVCVQCSYNSWMYGRFDVCVQCSYYNSWM